MEYNIAYEGIFNEMVRLIHALETEQARKLFYAFVEDMNNTYSIDTGYIRELKMETKPGCVHKRVCHARITCSNSSECPDFVADTYIDDCLRTLAIKIASRSVFSGDDERRDFIDEHIRYAKLNPTPKEAEE